MLRFSELEIYPFRLGITGESLDAAIALHGVSIVLICLASTMWTILYDTVYANQDVEDDMKVGILLMSFLLGESTSKLCGALTIAHSICLIAAGRISESGKLYYTGCGLSSFALAYLLFILDLKDPESCAYFFKASISYVGEAIIL